MVKKVLLLSNMYPSRKTPSFGVFVENIEKNLKEQGLILDKVVITGNSSSKFIKLLKYLRYFISACAALMKGDRTVYLHFISHSGLPILLMSKLVSIKLISHAHGGDIIPTAEDSLRIKRFKKVTSGQILKLSDKVIVPSKWFKNYVAQEYEIFKGKIFVSPSGGVDLNVFYSKNRFEKDRCLNIGFAGRLVNGKGADTLLRALGKLNSVVKCQFAGAGAERDNLKSLSEELNLSSQVTFHGVFNQRELAVFYRSLDFLIFPTELEESLGLVGLEAMACGTPIIAPMKAGLTDYFEPEINGLEFEAGNSSSLALAIERAVSMSPDEYQALCKNALATAKRFDSNKVNQELFKVLSEC